jgi:hypothetical protein
VGIIATQVLGDLGNFLTGDFVRGGIGFAIAGALLFYLLRPEVRVAFSAARSRLCDADFELPGMGQHGIYPESRKILIYHQYR